MPSPPPSDSSNQDQPACCAAKNRQVDIAAFPRRHTRRSFLLAGSALILTAIIFWHPLQQRCLAYFLLRSEAPSEDALSAAVEQASDPASLLTQLWRTQRIPHRQFVLTFLSRASTANPALLQSLEPLLQEAAGDADITARESALATFARMKHPLLRTLALTQLPDTDPAARLLGLQTLRSTANSNDVPIAIRFLSDPEPRVVVAAALLLRQATGQDFGIRTSHALPQFTGIDTNPPPAPDLPVIRQGVQRWQEWWTTHQAEYPEPTAAPMPRGPAARLATADFTLEGSAGQPTRLSQFRGKTVLFAFWSQGTPASLDDVPALKSLRQRNPDRLAILGVCIPAAPSCADEHDHGHDHAHHHHDASAADGTGAEHMRRFVQDAVTQFKIDFPMLLDPKGSIARRFSIEDLPAYVLIDADGMVRRRFVGFRTEPALAAIVEEVASSGPMAAKPSLSADQH